MISLLKFILPICLFFNAFAQTDPLNGRLTVYKFSDGLKYQTYQVDKKSFITNNVETLKTHEIDINTFELTTQTNEFATILFASGTVIRVEQGSEFRVDLMNMVLKNTNTFPSKIDIETSSLNISLMEGESHFSVNGSILLQTSLSNLGLETGRYFVQSTKKSVMVYILDGTLDVYDNVTNKKEPVKSGNAVLIRPSPVLSPRQMELFGDKMVTSVKKVKTEQFKPFLDTVIEMESVKNEVVFVKIGLDIIGVKIK